jgi:hypothetical protein
MKILLDENIDIRFKQALASDTHQIYTVKDMQWNGVKNGALLTLLKEHAFNVLIAVDKNLPYQQNKELLPVTIIIPNVRRNTLSNLLPFVPLIHQLLSTPQNNEVIVLDID